MADQEQDIAAVPDYSPRDQTHTPPSSPGLPPSSRKEFTLQKQRRRHPAAVKAQLEKTEDIIKTAEMVLAGRSLPSAAAANEVAVDSRPVKELVRQARERFVRRVDDYVEIHLRAAQIAAEDGDAKPAQWALERIHYEGERVVDPVNDKPTGNSSGLRIGVMIGGIPQPASQQMETSLVTVDELPPMEAKPPEELMP